RFFRATIRDPRNHLQTEPIHSGATVHCSASWLIVCHADQVDLDQRVLDQQASRADRRARWRDLQIFFPYLVEGKEVIEIGEEDLRLENILERASRGLEGLLEIFQHEAGLKLDVRSVEWKIRVLARLSRDAGFENRLRADQLRKSKDLR